MWYGWLKIILVGFFFGFFFFFFRESPQKKKQDHIDVFTICYSFRPIQREAFLPKDVRGPVISIFTHQREHFKTHYRYYQTVLKYILQQHYTNLFPLQQYKLFKSLHQLFQNR